MTKQRYYSLDVFRGATVALMILVNNPGTWAHMFAPLKHAAWLYAHGFGVSILFICCWKCDGVCDSQITRCGTDRILAESDKKNVIDFCHRPIFKLVAICAMGRG